MLHQYLRASELCPLLISNRAGGGFRDTPGLTAALRDLYIFYSSLTCRKLFAPHSLVK